MDIDTLEFEFPWNDYLLETDPRRPTQRRRFSLRQSQGLIVIMISLIKRVLDPTQRNTFHRTMTFLDPIQRRNLPRNLMVMARNLMVMRTALA